LSARELISIEPIKPLEPVTITLGRFGLVSGTGVSLGWVNERNTFVMNPTMYHLVTKTNAGQRMVADQEIAGTRIDSLICG